MSADSTPLAAEVAQLEALTDSYAGPLFRPESVVATCHLRCLSRLPDVEPSPPARGAAAGEGVRA